MVELSHNMRQGDEYGEGPKHITELRLFFGPAVFLDTLLSESSCYFLPIKVTKSLKHVLVTTVAFFADQNSFLMNFFFFFQHISTMKTTKLKQKIKQKKWKCQGFTQNW